MKRCENRFDCCNFLVYDCCGYDCFNDGYTYNDYLNDHDQDDVDLVG